MQTVNAFFRREPAALIGAAWILLWTTIALTSTLWRPDPTPNANDQHLEWSMLAPGTTVGLLANGFPDSVAFLDAVGDAIVALRPGITLARYDKGDASSIAGDTMLADVEQRCGAVVAAYGH